MTKEEKRWIAIVGVLTGFPLSVYLLILAAQSGPIWFMATFPLLMIAGSGFILTCQILRMAVHAACVWIVREGSQ